MTKLAIAAVAPHAPSRAGPRLRVLAWAVCACLSSPPAGAQDVAPEPTPDQPAPDAPAAAPPAEAAPATPPDAGTPAAAPAPAEGPTPTTPATPAEPAAGPGDRGGEAPPGAKSSTRTVVYECTDVIRIRRGDQEVFSLSGRCFAVVWTTTTGVTVEVRPAMGGDEAGASATPGSGKVSLGAAGDADRPAWDLPAAAVAYEFRPSRDEPVRAKALSESAAAECTAILGQSLPSSSILAGDTLTYDVKLVVDGSDVTLRATQKNEAYWLDWQLGGTGEVTIGAGGVQLPITFLGASDPPAIGRMRVDARIDKMTYSSMHAGPQDSFTIATTLSFEGRDRGLSYRRDCTLTPRRDLRDTVGEVPGEASRATAAARSLLAAGGLGGSAGTWARSMTLALLGTQSLAGLREAGLAAWLVQASVDTVAGARVPRAADREARSDLSRVGSISPGIAAPPELLQEKLRPGGRYRVVLRAARMPLEAGTAGTLSFADAEATTVGTSLFCRWRTSESLRLGVGVVASAVQSLESDQRFWYYAAVGGRLEIQKKALELGIALGPAYLWYQLQSETGETGGSVLGLGGEASLEMKLGRKLGIFYDVGIATDLDVFQMADETYGLRWHAKENLAIQVGLTTVSMTDAAGALGRVEQATAPPAGESLGVGVMARW